jgi:hypothetical protein
MIPMRGFVALVIVVVLGAIPAAAPLVQGMERGQFALAGWSSIDERTWGEIGTLRWWEHLPRQGG